MKMFFSKELYSKTALIKSAYSFTDKAYVHIDANDKEYIVDLIEKDGQSVDLKEFENEMLFQMARQKINEQTKDIRKLIVARAMASTVIDKEDDINSTGSIADETILTDWFEDK